MEHPVNKKTSYHHGSLRATALELARQLIATEGHDAVQIRHLAKAIGVTPAAMYGHFASRSDLLLELAEEAHQRLYQQLERFLASHPEPLPALKVAVRHFIDFCQANPGTFRMMYHDEVIHAANAEQRLASLARTYRLLYRMFLRAFPERDSQQIQINMICMWSTLYGFALVRNQQMLMPYMSQGLNDEALINQVVQAAITS